jgi:ornithine cyclodeaminase/alanine dehydrogenase-like protein (mu-crystallin family)
MSDALGFSVEATEDLPSALRQSDVCVTCTPSKNYFLRAADVPKGMFIAAVGADSPDKQELEPALCAENKTVADVLTQAIAVGEMHHAIAAGLMRRESVHAELGEIVAGKKAGRERDDEITIFDSTGTAFQDAAAAEMAYEKAVETGRGIIFDLYG